MDGGKRQPWHVLQRHGSSESLQDAADPRPEHPVQLLVRLQLRQQSLGEYDYKSLVVIFMSKYDYFYIVSDISMIYYNLYLNNQ